jgi:uncharacterized protein (DUF342 family)
MAQADAPSVIGDLATLQPGQVLLPAFVVKRGDSLYLDLSALDSPGIFLHFVERLFATEACFADIDYDLFLKLAFDYTASDIAGMLDRFESQGKSPEVRIARDIVAFPLSRQLLYRGIKLSPDCKMAEYLFEQIAVDKEIEVPVYGEVDENGDYPITHLEKTVVSERAYLDFDEFIAAMWIKGLRYGIDAAQVRGCIAADRSERLTIARQKDPMQGTDASIEERTDALHRDDSPHILPNGRMDLRQFRNRFPQVSAGMQLVRKLPRQPGVSGWNVQGKELLPDVLQDFDITTLAGPGTRIERSEAGEFVVASMDGFLNIDTQSSQLSVSEKIISREGVNARTTGDLALSGDEFEEHGEVQEMRTVNGHHMTFFANVFGKVSSDGGRIVFKLGITGGTARSSGGTITVEGAASNATLEAKRGVVDVVSAENCLLIGQTVRVGRAVRCDILADEIVIEHAEGCAIATQSAKIGKAAPRKDVDTIVTLLMPDVVSYERQIDESADERKQAETTLAARRDALAVLAAQPDMKTYLSLQPKIKAKTLVMNTDQERNWQGLLARLAPALRDYARIHGEVQKLQQVINTCDTLIETLKQERIEAISAVHCEIGEIAGETIVRSRYMRPDVPALTSLAAKELHSKLRDAGTPSERIFSGDFGSLIWPPAEAQKSD